MIKKFFEFVSGDKASLGQEIESLLDGEAVSEEQRRHIMECIVKPALASWQTRYGKEIDPSIRISAVIDSVLEDSDRRDMEFSLRSYLEKGVEEKEPIVSASASIEHISESAVAGKGVFHSFLKALTALGQKERPLSLEKCPDDFIFYHLYEDLDAAAVKEIFARFRSLEYYSPNIDYGKNEVSLYFGIKCGGYMEYGIAYESRISFGQFRLTQSLLKWLCGLESKSLFSIKKEIVNLSADDLVALGKIKADMLGYSPGSCESKMPPQVKDRVISFGYYGVGKWDNGVLDEGEYMNMKSNFLTWLSQKRWSDKVLISVKPGKFWLYIHIKLK